MRLVLLGPPGSGKGTQSARLNTELGICHLSSGDLLRDAVKRETELGKQAKGYMDAGRLVPDELVLAMMRERLSADDCRPGFLLDGFPRTLAQAHALAEMLDENGWPLDHAISLDVAESEILSRIQGRREQEARSDDDEATARQRLAVYEEQTKPLLEFYREAGLLTEIDGVGTPAEIYARISAVVGAGKGHEVDG